MTEANKRQFVRARLGSDRYSTDFLLTTLVTATRKGTVSVPSNVVQNLDVTMKQMPALRDSLIDKFNTECVDVMSWLLGNNNFHLKSCPKSAFDNIRQKVGFVGDVATPNFIFEVVYSDNREAAFEQVRGSRRTIHAFHGSRLENFYSILHHGLLGHLTKNALFGEGIYLSSELLVSLLYSPPSVTWANSQLGDTMACVALCEVIDDPAAVVCQTKEASSGGRRTTHLRGSVGGEVPEKYYVVTNNDLVRVKHLLVYSTFSNTGRQLRWRDWLRVHCWAVMLVFYVSMLLLVALSGSTTVRKYLQRLFNSPASHADTIGL